MNSNAVCLLNALIPILFYRNCNIKGFFTNFISVTNKNARVSVFNACNLPAAVDPAEVEMGIGLDDFAFL